MTATPSVQSNWEIALEAELATVGAPTPERLTAVVRSYQSLGLDDELERLAKRLSHLPVGASFLLPQQITRYVDRRDLRSLSQLLQNHKNVARTENTTADTHFAFAQAFALLKQPRRAAQHWRQLIEQDQPEHVNWEEFARFIAIYGNFDDLGASLEKRFSQHDTEMENQSFLLALLMCRVERDPMSAREILPNLCPESTAVPELTFALSLSAFRLGDLSLGDVSAQHGLKLRPGWRALESLRSSIKSFLASENVSGTPLKISSHCPDAVKEIANTVDSTQYAWGYLQRNPDGKIRATCAPLSALEDRDLEVPEDDSVEATFSILPDAGAEEKASGKLSNHPDPMQLLPYVDWSALHLMYQRMGANSRFHAFVKASEVHGDWCFSEVPFVGDETSDTASDDRNRTGASRWNCVLAELEQVDLEDPS